MAGKIRRKKSTERNNAEETKVEKKAKKKEPKKKDAKKQSAAKKAASYLLERFPYKFTPSYFRHNGMYGRIVTLNVREGTNRGMTYNEIIDFIPRSTLEGVRVFIFCDDTLIHGDQKKSIIRENSRMNRNSIESEEEEESGKTSDTKADKDTRVAQMQDYLEYEELLQDTSPIVIYRWTVVVTGPSPQAIDDQIEDINTNLAQNHSGATWSNVAGRQFYQFQHLFGDLPETRFENASTGPNYAGLSLAVNAGLNDELGIPVGPDVLSLTNTTGYFDFERYTFKQAAIAIPRSAYCVLYKDESRVDQVPVASILAQAASEQVMLEGHRVHHIVMNDFDYFEKGVFYTTTNIDRVYKRYDMSKLTVNPLQGWGDIENVMNIYARLTDKIVNIFDLLLDLSTTAHQKGIILDAIEQFYFTHDLFTPEVKENPRLSNIVDIDDPETYPTLAMFTQEFETLIANAMHQGRENKAENTETLGKLLSSALSRYPHALTSYTNIEETKALQVYYQFNGIESDQLKQIQLVNLIDYITSTAAKDDLIVIHGFDEALAVTAQMISSTIESAQRRGVRFIFAFDSVISKDVRGQKSNDIIEMKGDYYTDLHTDMDWTVIGKCVGREVEAIEDALNQNLGDSIRSFMQSPSSSNALFHRNRGGVNNFIEVRPYI